MCNSFVIVFLSLLSSHLSLSQHLLASEKSEIHVESEKNGPASKKVYRCGGEAGEVRMQLYTYKSRPTYIQ